jgi:hypothetical protein
MNSLPYVKGSHDKKSKKTGANDVRGVLGWSRELTWAAR